MKELTYHASIAARYEKPYLNLMSGKLSCAQWSSSDARQNPEAGGTIAVRHANPRKLVGLLPLVQLEISESKVQVRLSQSQM
jgi:hypothetical protein